MSKRSERRVPALTAALSGERKLVDGLAGALSYYVAGAYYVAGRGRPLLLVHSINAAASAYEVRPIFEAMRTERRVYAPDLPGFGFSDRSRRHYRIDLYVDAIIDMLDIIEEDCGPEPVDVLALSLSSEFVAQVAVRRPERFNSLVLVTPTGFGQIPSIARGRSDGSREIPGLHAFFTFPLWRRAFFDVLTSRRSIRFFLVKTFGRKDIDEDLVDYDHLTARQPGAEHAPYAFVSGRLFSSKIRETYEQLDLPVWVPHATRGDFRDFSDAGWAQAKPNWHFRAMETGALPHFEEPELFLSELRAFLDAHAPVEAMEADHSSLSEARSPSP